MINLCKCKFGKVGGKILCTFAYKNNFCYITPTLLVYFKLVLKPQSKKLLLTCKYTVAKNDIFLFNLRGKGDA